MTESKKMLILILIFTMVLFSGSIAIFSAYAETSVDGTGVDSTAEETEAVENDEDQVEIDEENTEEETTEEKNADEEIIEEENDDDVVEYREINVKTVREPLYKNKEETWFYYRTNIFWNSLMHRDAKATSDDLDLNVIVGCDMPKDITAELHYINLDESDIYSEQGILSFEVVLYDKNGEIYTPDGPVKVYVQGNALKNEIEDGNALILYSYKEAEKRTEHYKEKYGKSIYAADVDVYKSSNVNDDNLKYETYSENKDYKKYEDAVRYNDDVLYDDTDSVIFEYDYDAGKHFILSSQMKTRTLKTVSGENTITAKGSFGEEVALKAVEIKENNKYYDGYIEETEKALNKEGFSFARAFDIKLVDKKTGEEFQPDSDIKITINLKDEDIDDGTVDVVHFAEKKPEVIDAKTDGSKIKFTVDGFSVYVITYTVDFHWGNYTYSIKGQDNVLLSKLLKELKVEEISIDDVRDVHFSDDSLIKIEKKENDWLLTSLNPFRSDETLTLDLKNGNSVEIKVTDATLPVAEQEWTNGTIGSGTWEITANGTLIYGGHGISPDGANAAAEANTPWRKPIDYRNDIKKVTISGISELGQNTFNRHRYIEEADLSNNTNLTIIHNDAFKMNSDNETALKKVNLSGCTNLTTIENNAFFHCAKIEELDISGTKITSANLITTKYGFWDCRNSLKKFTGIGCTNFTNLNLSSYSKLQEVRVSDCSNMTSINLPNTITVLDVVGCEKLTSLNLSGKTSLKNLRLPAALKNFSVLDLRTCTGLTANDAEIYYDGSESEWEKMVDNGKILLPDGIDYNHIKFKTYSVEKSDILNDFVDRNTVYTIDTNTEERSISTPAYARDNSTLNMKLHFSEIAEDDESDFDARQLVDSFSEDEVLIYTLPENVDISIDDGDIYSEPVIINGSIVGNVTYNPSTRNLEMRWTVSDPAEQTAIRKMKNISFTLSVPVKINTSVPTSINFGNDENQIRLDVENIHNPKVVSKEVVNYDTKSQVITYKAVVTAEGNVDNGETEYPVIINDDKGMALSFASGEFTYTYGGTHDTPSIISCDGETTEASENATEFNGFPVTIEHMHDGDTIEFNYTMNVDLNNVSSISSDELGNRLRITNENNIYNDTSDDTSSLVMPDLDAPFLKMSASGEGTENEPKYQFKLSIGNVSENVLNANGIEIKTKLDTDSEIAKLWQLYIGEDESMRAKAIAFDDSEEASQPVAMNATYNNGEITFILSGMPTKGDGSYYKYYQIVFYVVPKDDPSVGESPIRKIKELAVKTDAGEEAGKQVFNAHAFVDADETPFNIASAKYTYEYSPIKKRMTKIDGNWASYEINVNPDELLLNNESTLVMQDTFSRNQSIDYSSIDVNNGNVSYDYRGWTGTFKIPDGINAIITYKTRITETAGEEVTFSNKAVLNSLFSASVSNTRKIYPGKDDVSENVDDYYVRIFKYADGHMEKGLNGAKFRLLDAKKERIKYKMGAHAGEDVIFETENDGKKDGYADVLLDENQTGISIKKNTAYYLEEVVAPEETNGEQTTYYQKDNMLYGFSITDNPDYNVEGVYSYFNGDILKVRNSKETPGVKLSKHFMGNIEPTSAQKNEISFELQKSVDGDWETIETGGYSDFSDGVLNFTSDLEVGESYRVIEQDAEIDGAELETTWTVNNASTNEFTVTEENIKHSINVVCTNEYVEHKMTIKTVDELDSKALKGATFNVYTVSGSLIKTYTTGNDGTLEIKQDDDVRYEHTGTMFYAVESAAPDDYILPENPEKFYFYFSDEDDTSVPGGISSAVDLSTTYANIIVENGRDKITIPTLVRWNINGSDDWPASIENGTVVIGLYRSENGGTPVPVKDSNENDLTVTLDKNNPFDAETFTDLPAMSNDKNRYTYSLKELHIYNNEHEDVIGSFAPSYYISDSGIYVVRNVLGTNLTVKKQWLDENYDKEPITFDVFRSTETIETGVDGYIFGTDLEERLDNFDVVQTGVSISKEDNWEKTIHSLEKEDKNGNLYHYYVLETAVDGMTDNYKIEGSTITILNSGERKYICRVDNNGVENLFYSISDAVKYIEENAGGEGEVKMLTDYNMPSSDSTVIPNGCKVTITTATSGENKYTSHERTEAMIKRYKTFRNAPMFTNKGTLTFDGITLDGNGTEVSSSKAMVSNEGELTIKENATLQNARMTGNGGAVYAEKGTVNVLGNLIGNEATNGGAIYVKEGATVNVSTTGEIKGNSASNGGAIFNSGTLNISGNASMTENTATGNGGAIYSSGNINMLGGEIKRNSANNGSAVYVFSGNTTFGGGTITNNTATNGGAVGVNDTRLSFSGNIEIIGNKKGTEDCNVYLNQDSNSIITMEALGDNANVGIYVPDVGVDNVAAYDLHGKIFARFGTYIGNAPTNIHKFVSDRDGYKGARGAKTGEIIWSQPIQFDIRYVSSFAGGFPQENGNVIGTTKCADVYYPTSNDITVDNINVDLKTEFAAQLKGLSKTAIYGYTYTSNATAFSDYIIRVRWNDNQKKWEYIGNNEQVMATDDDSIIIYYTEAAYITIVNNSGLSMDKAEESVLEALNVGGKDAINDKYGFLVAVNGKMHTKRSKITQNKLELITAPISENTEVNEDDVYSVMMLFPGACGLNYSYVGGFEETIDANYDGKVHKYDNDGTSTVYLDNITDYNVSGKLRTQYSDTTDITFGDAIPICRIRDVKEETFSTLNYALDYIKNSDSIETDDDGNKVATISMLVDYIIPDSDRVNLSSSAMGGGFDITITTAKEGTYHYKGSGNAMISRGYQGGSMITVKDGKFSTRDITFDGGNGGDPYNADLFKNTSTEHSGGGILKGISGSSLSILGGTTLQNSSVPADVVGVLGGAIYSSSEIEVKGTSDNHVSFKNSYSNSGGGLTVESLGSEVNIEYCDFDNCVAYNDGGAIHHYVGKKTTINHCTFKHHEVRLGSGGAIQENVPIIEMRNSTFYDCKSFKEGGGVRQYRNPGYKDNDWLENTPTSIFSNLEFEKCYSTDEFAYTGVERYRRGGAINGSSDDTTIEDCKFKDCVVKTYATGKEAYGGAVCIRDRAESLKTLVVRGCEFDSCSVDSGISTQNSSGGALDSYAPSTVIDDCTFNKCTSFYRSGGAIHCNRQNSNVEITNVDITNSKALNDGGGIYLGLSNGTASISQSSIKNTSAVRNGGGMCVYAGTLNMDNVSIEECNSENGGGIYQACGVLNLNNGIIKKCEVANSGGGIFVMNGKKLYLNDCSITENVAAERGGGIASDGTNSRLYFAGTENITENRFKKGDLCNVELSSDTNVVINENVLDFGSTIGVYVSDKNGLYEKHGVESKPFGVFDRNKTDTNKLYCFVNDRNGLKGGLLPRQNISSDSKIYWVKIFSIEVSKEVIAKGDKNQEFDFEVELSGNSLVNPSVSAEDINGDYGDMHFESEGTGSGKTKAVFTLKNGEKITGENIDPGFEYTVREIHENTDYAILPKDVQRGVIGENKDTTKSNVNPYISVIKFVNMLPICKVTDTEGNLLYQDYKAFDGKVYKVPAVYMGLSDAVDAIGGKLYPNENAETTYSDNNGFSVKMLVERYNLTKSISIKEGKKITLTTTSKEDSQFPYRGDETSTIKRNGFKGASMFKVDGILTLKDITLDGNENYTVGAKGGVVYVNNGGNLKVKNNTTIQNSNSKAYGSAIYIEKGASADITNGKIWKNSSTLSGAGIYIEQDGVLRISGSPTFGTGNNANRSNVSGYSSKENGGNKEYSDNRARQDIFIEGYGGADGDKSADSLVVTGNIDSGDGSIWVWAEKSPHYKIAQQFAKINSETTITDDTLKVFRNAQDDAATRNQKSQTPKYVYGIKKGNDTENIYWCGIEGTAFIELVKVLDESGVYKTLSGKTFSVYSDSDMKNVAIGKIWNSDGSRKVDIELKDIKSGNGGAFFIGELPYSTYYVKEDGVSNKHFEFTVDEGGVVYVTGTETTPRKTVELVSN